MITINCTFCNPISQDSYDKSVNSIQFHQLTCSCGHAACMTRHGYYRRSIKSPTGKIRLRICRVICTECGATHALLPSSIVPYSQTAMADQHHIICDYENGSCPNNVCTPENDIDENNVKAVILRYRRHWREKLRAESISLKPLSGLIQSCFSLYSSQFMQIRRTFNSLFADTT